MMKKSILILLTLLVVTLVMVGCGGSKSTTTQSQTTNPPTQVTTNPPKTSQPTTALTKQPKTGGSLLIINNIMSQDIGYQPNFGSEEGAECTLFAEGLTEFNMMTGEYHPLLASSWDEDVANKTLTVHLRQGVKFHDNTDFDADAVKWNFDNLQIATKKLSIWQNVQSIDVLDKATVRFTFKDYIPHRIRNSKGC